jgi:hypothetical protein
LSCGQSSSSARTVFIRDVVANSKKTKFRKEDIDETIDKNQFATVALNSEDLSSYSDFYSGLLTTKNE